MKEFKVMNLSERDIELELDKIGFDSSYKKVASDKFKYKNIKIFDLTSAQVNILKQTALSVGADCASHRDVITNSIEKSNAILGGSYSQIKKIAEKLKSQPFSLSNLAEILLNELEQAKTKTKLVGILNVTPDSFSDGGKYYEPQLAIEHAYKMAEDGADMIDIGAESTRPFSTEVSAEEQIRRLKPVLTGLKNINIPLSIDTRSSEVADFSLNNGAKIINDVSGLNYDSHMVDVVAKYNATVIIQHSQGTPETMQINPTYKDVIEEVYLNLLNKINYAKSKGVGVNNIIADVGIGFGKTKEDNYKLLDRIDDFKSLGLPLMVGLSRKSLLGINNDNNELKDTLSLALSYPLIKKEIDYLRVHNVKLHKQLLNITM